MEYKGYVIRWSKTENQWEIAYNGKGSVPMTLCGLYTTKDFAKRAIDSYVDTKPEK